MECIAITCPNCEYCWLIEESSTSVSLDQLEEVGVESMNLDRPKSRQSMLVVTLPESKKEVGIMFRHFVGKTIVRGENITTKMTRCNIYELFSPDEKKEPVLINWGVAKCSIKDQFNKEVGRKIALTRAILCGDHFLATKLDKNKKPIPVTSEVKNDRTAIWFCYLNRAASHTPEEGSAADQPVVEGEVVGQKLLPPSSLEVVPVPSTIH